MSEVAQSCPTLCDPIDGSPPGSPVPGILQARTLEWVAFPSPGDLPNPGIEPGSPALQAGALPSEPPAAAAAKSFQSGPTLCHPIDGSPAGSLIPGILQARTLEWVAFPSPGDLPDPGIEPGSCASQADALRSEPPGMHSRLTGKDPGAGKDGRQKEKRAAEDEMVGWHHQLGGHESEQTPGDSEGQGNPACCSP